MCSALNLVDRWLKIFLHCSLLGKVSFTNVKIVFETVKFSMTVIIKIRIYMQKIFEKHVGECFYKILVCFSKSVIRRNNLILILENTWFKI